MIRNAESAELNVPTNKHRFMSHFNRLPFEIINTCLFPYLQSYPYACKIEEIAALRLFPSIDNNLNVFLEECLDKKTCTVLTVYNHTPIEALIKYLSRRHPYLNDIFHNCIREVHFEAFTDSIYNLAPLIRLIKSSVVTGHFNKFNLNSAYSFNSLSKLKFSFLKYDNDIFFLPQSSIYLCNSLMTELEIIKQDNEPLEAGIACEFYNRFLCKHQIKKLSTSAPLTSLMLGFPTCQLILKGDNYIDQAIQIPHLYLCNYVEGFEERLNTLSPNGLKEGYQITFLYIRIIEFNYLDELACLLANCPNIEELTVDWELWLLFTASHTICTGKALTTIEPFKNLKKLNIKAETQAVSPFPRITNELVSVEFSGEKYKVSDHLQDFLFCLEHPQALKKLYSPCENIPESFKEIVPNCEFYFSPT